MISGAPLTVVMYVNRSPGILMSTILIDEEGAEVMSLGQLMYKGTPLENRVAMLHASICAQ